MLPAMSLDDALRQRIDHCIESDDVVVFMKGHRAAPQCGFSATVVEVLDGYLDHYQSVDVLQDEALREGLKVYSSWPTIPQIYVDGEFIGGCDILREMHQSGELRSKLGDKIVEIAPPKIEVSPEAAVAVRQAVGLEDGEVLLRLRVDPRYYNELSVEQEGEPEDFRVESEGITVLVDRASARRANGVRIEFVQNEAESGFRVDNPGAPTTVRQISVTELSALLREKPAGLRFIDVRRDEERELCSIADSEQYSMELDQELQALDRNTPLVFICHSGGRSQRLAEEFVQRGFSDVINVLGGIDAWAAQIDPEMRRY